MAMMHFVCHLSNENKERVLALMTPLHYPTGSYICRQKSVGNSFFIIVDGFKFSAFNRPSISSHLISI